MAVVKITLFIVCVVVLCWETQAFCSGKSDCPQSQVCCNYDECRDSCVGYDCVVDSNCGGDDEHCCGYTCQNGDCGLAAWIIVVIVLSVIGVITTVVVLVLCYYCSYRQSSPGLVVHVSAPVETAAVVPGSNVYNYGAVYPVIQPQPPYGSQPPPYQPSK